MIQRALCPFKTIFTMKKFKNHLIKEMVYFGTLTNCCKTLHLFLSTPAPIKNREEGVLCNNFCFCKFKNSEAFLKSDITQSNSLVFHKRIPDAFIICHKFTFSYASRMVILGIRHSQEKWESSCSFLVGINSLMEPRWERWYQKCHKGTEALAWEAIACRKSLNM